MKDSLSGKDADDKRSSQSILALAESRIWRSRYRRTCKIFLIYIAKPATCVISYLVRVLNLARDSILTVLGINRSILSQLTCCIDNQQTSEELADDICTDCHNMRHILKVRRRVKKLKSSGTVLKEPVEGISFQTKEPDSECISDSTILTKKETTAPKASDINSHGDNTFVSVPDIVKSSFPNQTPTLSSKKIHDLTKDRTMEEPHKNTMSTEKDKNYSVKNVKNLISMYDNKHESQKELKTVPRHQFRSQFSKRSPSGDRTTRSSSSCTKQAYSFEKQNSAESLFGNACDTKMGVPHNMNQSANATEHGHEHFFGMLLREHNKQLYDTCNVNVNFQSVDGRCHVWYEDFSTDLDQMFAYMEKVPPSLILQKCNEFYSDYAQQRDDITYQSLVLLLKRLHQYLVVHKTFPQTRENRSRDEVAAMVRLEQFKDVLFRKIFIRRNCSSFANVTFPQFKENIENKINRELKNEYASYRKRKNERLSTANVTSQVVCHEESTSGESSSDESECSDDRLMSCHSTLFQKSKLKNCSDSISNDIDTHASTQKAPPYVQPSSSVLPKWSANTKESGPSFVRENSQNTDQLANKANNSNAVSSLVPNHKSSVTKNETGSAASFSTKTPNTSISRTKEKFMKTALRAQPKQTCPAPSDNNKAENVSVADLKKYEANKSVPVNLQNKSTLERGNNKSLCKLKEGTSAKAKVTKPQKPKAVKNIDTRKNKNDMRVETKAKTSSTVDPDMENISKERKCRETGKQFEKNPVKVPTRDCTLSSSAESTSTESANTSTHQTTKQTSEKQEAMSQVQQLKTEDSAKNECDVEYDAQQNNRIIKWSADHDTATCSVCQTNSRWGTVDSLLERGYTLTRIKTMIKRGSLLVHKPVQKVQSLIGPNPAALDCLRLIVNGVLKVQTTIADEGSFGGLSDGEKPCVLPQHEEVFVADDEAERSKNKQQNEDITGDQDDNTGNFSESDEFENEKHSSSHRRRRFDYYASDENGELVKCYPEMLNGLFGDPWSPENLKYLPIKERRRLWKLRKNNVNKEPAQESQQQAEIETEHGQGESQTFLPEGATFDFSRLAVEPGHGDRPNKKKLKEEIKGKVKTKGKPNKHLEANKSDFDQYGYYVAEDIPSNENRDNKDVVMGGATEESSIFADDHLPSIATELPQTVDDRELNMVPEEIIRKEDTPSKLRDLEEKYTLSSPAKKEKQRKRKDKKSKVSLTVNFFG